MGRKRTIGGATVGRRLPVNLCIYTESVRIVLVESKLDCKSTTDGKAADGEAST